MTLLVLPPCELDSIDIRLQPLGISYIASYLRENGEECEIIDGLNDNNFNDVDKIIRYILSKNFNVVGFSVNTIAFDNAIYIARKLKKYKPNINIVFGGHHSTYMHREILEENECVDYIIRGEGELAFFKLVNSIKTKMGYEFIDGLSYKDKNNNIIVNRNLKTIENLDNLPFPIRINSDIYTKTWDNEINEFLINVPIISSRGCSNNCAFCSISSFQEQMDIKKIWRCRSADNIVKEVSEIVYKYKNVFIRFADDNFLVNINRAMDIAEKIFEICGKKIKFSFAARSDQIVRCGIDRMKKLRSFGCINIEVGIESGSESFLNRYCKDTTVEINEKALAILRKVNIYPSVNFIMFDNITALEELKANIDFIKKNHLMGHYPPIIYNRIIPYPGTKVYKSNLIDKNNYFINQEIRYIYTMLYKYKLTYQSKLDKIINSNINDTSVELKVIKQFATIKPYEVLEELIDLSSQKNEKLFTELDSVKSTEQLIDNYL